MGTEALPGIEGENPPLPPVGPPAGRRHRWIWVAVAVAVLIPLMVGAIAVLGGGEDPDDTSEQATTWDPRVEDLVKFVEDTRGLTFDHPVPIEFLSEQAFDAKLTDMNRDLSPKERRSVRGI